MKLVGLIIALLCAGCTTTFHLEDYEQWSTKHEKELSQEMLNQGSTVE